MNENKYYLKIDNRIIAERVSLEHALIFIKSIFENYYNNHEIVISIAEMKLCEGDEIDEWRTKIGGAKMNYMPEVAKMLGVELGDKFKIKSLNGE